MHYRIRYMQVKYQLNRNKRFVKTVNTKKNKLNCMDGRIDNNRYFFRRKKKLLIIRRSHNCYVARDARTKCTCKNVLWK